MYVALIALIATCFSTSNAAIQDPFLVNAQKQFCVSLLPRGRHRRVHYVEHWIYAVQTASQSTKRRQLLLTRGGAMTARLSAVEFIRRMRGGSQSKLMRCSDDEYYVVKFQDNPQGTRILANELLATRLARRMGLPVPEPAIVDVCPELIRHTDELVMQFRDGYRPCRPGLCFGSRLVSTQNVVDFLPDDLLRNLRNLYDFVGTLVFDKWVGNDDHRQVVFARESDKENRSPYRVYRAAMIDNGHCFGGPRWDVSAAPRQGLYIQPLPYLNIQGFSEIEPWLERLDREMRPSVLEEAASEIPAEWYDGDRQSLAALLATLDDRRRTIRHLLLDMRRSAPDFFPSWAYQARSAAS